MYYNLMAAVGVTTIFPLTAYVVMRSTGFLEPPLCSRSFRSSCQPDSDALDEVVDEETWRHILDECRNRFEERLLHQM